MQPRPQTTPDRSHPEFPGLEDRLLVVYDGYCGFCNRSIRWFIARDPWMRLRFVPADAPQVAPLLARYGIDALRPNSLLVAVHAGQSNERLLQRTSGILAMLLELPSPWPSYAGLLRYIPRALRDFAYDCIAALRYRIAGRHATCPIPSPEERAHFLA